jgi:CRISPR-associated protein Csx17
MSASSPLPVVSVPGLRPSSLGKYLASLGLLNAVHRVHPGVRCAWHEGVFCLVGGPSNIDNLVADLDHIAANRNWTPYKGDWQTEQKKSTKHKTSRPLALWQASAPESELTLFSAHIVPLAPSLAGTVGSGLIFNPMLGTGGNAGKRKFFDGWAKATSLLAQCEPSKRMKELRAFVLGEVTEWTLKDLNGASWFSETNKIYNSGQGAFKEGRLSPWAMVLACEGLIFFVGSASRRLGTESRARGAFPFITTRGLAPISAGECGHDLAEVWAPVWQRPMTVQETAMLFSRGRAEVNGRGAATPAAFATAALARGCDAGIAEFRRFVLGRTTSAQTFEARFDGVITVGSHPSDFGTAEVLRRLLGLVNRLPEDRKEGKSWRFRGLRGRLEAQIVLLAASKNAENARKTLDAAVYALDRVDRNTDFRKRRVEWEPLPTEWIPALFNSPKPTLEARLALSLVASFPRDLPFAVYRFGVESRGQRYFVHPEKPPARWVWRPGPLAQVLGEVLARYVLDWESAAEQGKRCVRRALVPALPDDIQQWLTAALDEEEFRCWISRFSLFDWRCIPSNLTLSPNGSIEPPQWCANLALVGLFQPLFDQRPLPYPTDQNGHRSSLDADVRNPAAARALLGFLRVGNLTSALAFAKSRYSMLSLPLCRTRVAWRVDVAERLCASILFPLRDRDRWQVLNHWLKPERT